jgi:SAM-dependent methyltransferase
VERLAPDYEQYRSRDDSLDRLVEWPAQRNMLGDVAGRSVLDLGCGNGGKLIELMRDGAVDSVGSISASIFCRSRQKVCTWSEATCQSWTRSPT